MNKTISINPDLFKFSNNRTSKKNKESSKSNNNNNNNNGNNIKVRDTKQDIDKRKRLRKQHVLRFIREQQEQNYRKLIDGDHSIKTNKPDNNSNKSNTDFDESMKYLKTLTDSDNKPNIHNQTLKQPFSSVNNNIQMDIEPVIHTKNFDDCIIDDSNPTLPLKQQPSWGCLKNGTLPTYRNWKNCTQKRPIDEQITKPSINVLPPNNIIRNEKINEVRSLINDSKISHKPKNRYLNQKRTIRRTYNLGKSKTKPTISVLISNKTIRNNIMTKTQLMKQKSIDEIKRFLVKNGFIRVGTSAPNDVLRKMYETASLMCGEINNHNPDNILYNYLNNSMD